MIDIILSFFWIIKTVMTFSLFTYIYKYFYESCGEKKIIKTKDGRPKKVLKIRASLAIVYLLLLSIIFYLLNVYTLFVLLVCGVLACIFLIHQFEPSILEILKKYEMNNIFKKCWFVYSFLLKMVFKIFSPLYNFFDIKLNVIKEKAKSKIFEKMTTVNVLDDFNSMTTFFQDNKIKEITKSNDKLLNDKKEM
jgi:hypothetical protein